jgi:hypothetical protein
MRGERIGLARDLVEREGNADFSAHPGHARIDVFGAGCAEFSRDVFLPAHAGCGHVGVELERPPGHAGLIGTRVLARI